MKKFVRIISVAALLLMVLSLPLSQTLAAPNETCSSINGKPYNTTGFVESYSVNLIQGETIGGTGATVQFPTSNPAQDVYVEIDGNSYTDGFEPFNWSFTAPSTATYQVEVTVASGDGLFTAGSWTCGEGSVPAAQVLIPQILDGRTNRFDLAAPVAIFASSSTIDVYAINEVSGEGRLILQIDLSNMGSADGETHLLNAAPHSFNGYPVEIYQLPNGTFQVNATSSDLKPYTYNW